MITAGHFMESMCLVIVRFFSRYKHVYMYLRCFESTQYHMCWVIHAMLSALEVYYCRSLTEPDYDKRNVSNADTLHYILIRRLSVGLFRERRSDVSGIGTYRWRLIS